MTRPSTSWGQPPAPPKPCRCGWRSDSGEPHPCHSDNYTCGQPAKERFYNMRPAALAGVNFKLTGDQTVACDECWENYQKYLKSEISQETWLAKEWIRNREKRNE